ncbi:MAG: hypothetical protein JJT90_01630 [Ectothiorhodospiraceae bacterium]|nr:hypothetical protein [Ectothiorhodospiraceae bacterium]
MSILFMVFLSPTLNHARSSVSQTLGVGSHRGAEPAGIAPARQPNQQQGSQAPDNQIG